MTAHVSLLGDSGRILATKAWHLNGLLMQSCGEVRA